MVEGRRTPGLAGSDLILVRVEGNAVLGLGFLPLTRCVPIFVHELDFVEICFSKAWQLTGLARRQSAKHTANLR